MRHLVEQPTASARHSEVRANTRARWAAPVLATAVLALAIGGSIASAAPSANVEGAGGTTSPVGDPPSAAEARSWDRAFQAAHASEDPDQPTSKTSEATSGKRAPGGALFPNRKVLSLYGSPGPNGFGVLGRKTKGGAARKLRKQIRPYRKRSSENVIKAFDLVSVIATRCSGSDDKCRVRVSKDTIRQYLKKIRDMNGRLILDIQPGRSNVLEEIKYLKEFVQKPNVDVALDAEWNVGPNGEPGEDLGSLRAKRINGATRKIRRIQNKHNLPPKLLIVHQFRQDSVRGEKNIKRPGKVDVTLNFDGIGGRSAKTSGYKSLSYPGLFNGFSLFYKLDDGLMTPGQVLKLRPQPDYIMYQ